MKIIDTKINDIKIDDIKLKLGTKDDDNIGLGRYILEKITKDDNGR